MSGRRIILLSALCLSVTAGCQSGRTTGPDEPAQRVGFFGGDRLNDQIEVPPGISDDAISPLQGDALSKAKWSMRKILSTLDRPAYLDPSEDQPPVDQIADEPPLAAQLAYVQARTAWLDGNPTLAKQKLEAALRLVPDEPVLLRLIGEVYTRTGNRIRGAQYFRQAVGIEPDDAASVYVLGRFASEKGDHDEAIVLFDDAIKKADDPALTELAHHFLGNALRNAGYIDAAIDQLDQYIELTGQSVRPSRHARDRVLLRRQIGVTFQLLGDLNLRLDRPDDALEAYELALRAGIPDPVKLDKRQIYAAMLDGDAELARGMVIQQLKRQRGDAQSLAMVRYAVKQGISAASLAEAIESVYQSQGRPATLAIAAADVLPDEPAKALLADHLQLQPADAQVFQRLLHYYLLPADQVPHTDQTLKEAADLTAQLMASAPSMADTYGSSLVTHAPDTRALLDVIERSAEQGKTMHVVLRGLCLAVLSRFDQAREQFELAVEQDEGLAVARIELAKVLVVQDQFDQAAEVLEPLSESDETGVILLRARVLAETDRTQDAVDLLERVIRQGDADAKLVITKANLEIRLGRVEDAEQTLQDALNAQPESEPLYGALLDLYDPEPGRQSVIKDQTAKWRILVKRLLGTIPNSRTGRLVQAQLHDASRNYDRAIAILEGLLTENANDPKAMTQLLDTYHAAGRNGEAIALLEKRLEAQPDNALLLQIAIRFYSQAGDQERLFEVQERLLLLEEDTPLRAGQLAVLYAQWGKHQLVIDTLSPVLAEDEVENAVLIVNLMASSMYELGQAEDAERLILESAKRFEAFDAELHYMLAVKLSTHGEPERGEQIMRDILVKHPDHGPTNNGLGYAMLTRNEAPAEALKLIQRAVDSEPGNEAYMDSLGWAYYKLGRFEDAEVWLNKAKQASLTQYRAARGQAGSATLAVVTDHLGDVLHQLGREPEALRAWAEAGNYLRRVTPEEMSFDPELVSMRERLSDKIKAVRAKEPVPVSEVVGEPDAPKPKEAPVPESDVEAVPETEPELSPIDQADTKPPAAPVRP